MVGILLYYTGCSISIVFFSEDLKNFPDSGLSLFSLGVSVCTHTRQVEHQRYSRNGRVQNNHKTLRTKKQYFMNTLYDIEGRDQEL